jgi:hypothetical protein
MSIIETCRDLDGFRLVAFDLYRDVHKGIRAELFALTASAGNLDHTNPVAWAAFAGHVDAVASMLTLHAEHEDTHIGPVLQEHQGSVASLVVTDHETLDASFQAVVDAAHAGNDAAAGVHRRIAHFAYLELAAFTAAYLSHQSLEERVIMPLLENAIGVEAVLGIHTAIIQSIPPDELARDLTLMLPAMNVEDRAELLAGVRATAPDEAFQAILGLARSVLAPMDFDAVATRIGAA